MKYLAILTMLVGSVGYASATVISYNTMGSTFTGTFNGTVANSNSITAKSGSSTATLIYNPVVVGSTFDDNVPGSNISYGSFTMSFAGPNVLISFPTFNFSLVVNETAPGRGTQTIAAASNTGQVSANSSNVDVFYVPTMFVLPSSVAPNTTYTIINPTQIVAPTTNGGVSSIQGFAVGTPATSTPEPASVSLMCVGLIGCCSILRKRVARGS